MSTRCFICIEDGGKYHGIYCHYDGYPIHVGRTLKVYHNSEKAARDLVFGPQIRQIHSHGAVERFNDQEPDSSEVRDSIEEAIYGFDYVYVFRNKQWECYGHMDVPYSGIEQKWIPS